MTYVETAIERIKEFCPPEGYWLAFSGGKDSQVVYHLAEMAGVPFKAYFNICSIDPPPQIYFVRKNYPGVEFVHPKRPFLKELVLQGFPMRQHRWCCRMYKERTGAGRYVLLGVRWEESRARLKRRMVEPCFTGGTGAKGKWYVNPIIDWKEEDVWEFLKGKPHCELYDKGWKRIGCLFCPFLSPKERLKQSKEFPKYRDNFIKAFEELHATGREGVKRWKNGRDMFWWWMQNPDEEKQQELFV